MITKFKKENKIENDDPVIEVQANILASLMPEVAIKKVFFQATSPNGADGWRLYIVTDKNEAIVLPVNPQCPIHLLAKEGLLADVEEFKRVTAIQKIEFAKQFDKKESDYSDFLDEAIKKKKTKKKTGK